MKAPSRRFKNAAIGVLGPLPCSRTLRTLLANGPVALLDGLFFTRVELENKKVVADAD